MCRPSCTCTSYTRHVLYKTCYVLRAHVQMMQTRLSSSKSRLCLHVVGAITRACVSSLWAWALSSQPSGCLTITRCQSYTYRFTLHVAMPEHKVCQWLTSAFDCMSNLVPIQWASHVFLARFQSFVVRTWQAVTACYRISFPLHCCCLDSQMPAASSRVIFRMWVIACRLCRPC